MKFKVYKNEKQLRNEELYYNDQKLIFIFHGLFGRAKNWHSIALRISSIFEVKLDPSGYIKSLLNLF